MSERNELQHCGLVHRLARRSRRPGLSWPQQGQQILDRHLSMARRSELVDRLSRRGRAEDHVHVPVVYVEPELADPAGPAASPPPPPAPVTAAAGVYVVNVERSTVTVGDHACGPVIQAKAVPDLARTPPAPATIVHTLMPSTTAADPSPSPEVATPREPADAVTPIWAGILTSSGREPTQKVGWQRSRPETRPSVEASSLVVVATTPIVPEAGAATALPVRPAPVSFSPTFSVLPVVVERGGHATPTTAIAPLRLPLATVIGARPDDARAPRAHDSWTTRVSDAAPADLSPTPVQQVGPQVPAVERPAIDIDRLADTVHARLLRRLAIERERRGVMR